MVRPSPSTGETRRSAAPHGKLAVLLPGLGAVSTTFVAGVELVRRRRAEPVGSIAELGTLSSPRGPGGSRPVPVREHVPLVPLADLVFGAWDIVREDGRTVAERSGVLTREHLEEVGPALSALRPRPGVHDPESVRRIQADHVKAETTHRARVAALRKDIRELLSELGADRAVMINCASTEVHRGTSSNATRTLQALEEALDHSDPAITPTMLYAYAALREGIPFANGTPNVSSETPAFASLAEREGVPVCGKDLKTGQTMIKTVLAPALKARRLGIAGWFSSNILGNRDGEVLEDPGAFRSKEVTKTGVLESILDPARFARLYGNLTHKIAIHYYPPRGDAKEGWDNVDIFGWMGYPMQLKLNFLCRDSILAAPLILDLALFLDLAKRSGLRGPQPWLSFYFKSPVADETGRVEHDLFAQEDMLYERLGRLGTE